MCDIKMSLENEEKVSEKLWYWELSEEKVFEKLWYWELSEEKVSEKLILRVIWEFLKQ